MSKKKTDLNLDEIPVLEEVVLPFDGVGMDAEILRQQLSLDLKGMVANAVDEAVTRVLPQIKASLEREITLQFERHLTEAVQLMLPAEKRGSGDGP